ncbi:MAG TPA: hypothetical protein VKI65_19510 [Gemmataceae bacterium]|nr:hypothetical protein [Gemmataceae bacterium]
MALLRIASNRHEPVAGEPQSPARLPSSVQDRLAPADRRLLVRAALWSSHLHLADLTVDAVRSISRHQGIDFATALLYDRLLRSPEHGSFIQRLESLPGTANPARPLVATVVIVPGAFYVEFPHTGADGRLLREVAAQFGCRSELIPIASFGSLAANARTICEWLTARVEEPVILVSLSKGGADMKTALAQPDGPQAFRNVVAWINLCGLVNGSPLVDWLMRQRLRRLWYRLLFWLRGYDFQVIPEMACGPGNPLDFSLQLPAHMRLISVVGFPLARHMSNSLARRCFRRLQDLGPNDGAGILLAEVCRLPGLLYPVWGADHYMRPAWGDVRTVAIRIMHYLCEDWDTLVPPGRRVGG